MRGPFSSGAGFSRLISVAMTTATLSTSAQPALPAPTRLSLRWGLLIVVYGATLLGSGLGNHVLTRHEVLAAYPAKEMLRNGHWIVQMFAGIPRTIKPPTTGWMIAACMAMFRSDAEWVVRLPSVAAAILTALMVAAFTARFYSQATGIIAGLIQLTCYYALKQATLAEADMPLCAAVTAAMLCFAAGTISPAQETNTQAAASRPSRLLSAAFYFFTGLAFLLKGPNGLIFILSAIVTYALVRRERHIFRFLADPIGTIIFVVLLVGWPLAAIIQRPQIITEWKIEMGATAAGGFGRNSIFTYLGLTPASLLPWAPAMAIGIYVMAKGGGCRRPLFQFFACWFLPGFIYLHFIALKSLHYPIPLLPPFSIAGAVGLLRYIDFQHWKPQPRRVLSAILFAACCVAAAIVVVFVPMLRPMSVPLWAALFVLCAGGLLAIYFEHRRWIGAQIGALAATAWGVIIIVSMCLLPRFDSYRPLADLARRANGMLPVGQMLYIIDEDIEVEPHAAYYLRPPIRRLPSPEAFVAFAGTQSLSAQRPVYVLCITSAQRLLERHFSVEGLDRCAALRRKEREEHRWRLAMITSTKD